MRLEDIRQHSGQVGANIFTPTIIIYFCATQDITVLEWTTEDKEKISPVLDWCLKFKQVPYMNGASY